MTNKLLLNDDKTEFLMIGTKQQLAKVNIDHILIGDSVIRPKGVVKVLLRPKKQFSFFVGFQNYVN